MLVSSASEMFYVINVYVSLENANQTKSTSLSEMPFIGVETWLFVYSQAFMGSALSSSGRKTKRICV